MSTPQIILQRPALEWPRDASLIGYKFSGLLVAALTQGDLSAYLGWQGGTVWARWGDSDSEEARLGVSLIMAVYALWTGGFLDVVVEVEARNGDVTAAFFVSSGKPATDLPPLEQDILNIIRAEPRAHAAKLVLHLPFPSRKRGIGAWFFSGAPSQQAKGESGWFKQTGKFYEEAPTWVQRALDLAKALVGLQAGMDLNDELERERRDQAMYTIETGIFESIQKLP